METQLFYGLVCDMLPITRASGHQQSSQAQAFLFMWSPSLAKAVKNGLADTGIKNGQRGEFCQGLQLIDLTLG